MKNRLYIILLFFSVTTFGQKTLKGFDGSLVFKETNFYEPINRVLTDTIINYFSFDIDTKNGSSLIEIKQAYTYRNEDKEYSFLKFKFLKAHDSLLISYRDPIKNMDVLEYMYPINKRDTIDNRAGYKICLDSILNSNHTYRKILEDCDNEPQFESTYTKDTIITFKDYSFNCYLIEQNYNAIRNQKLLRKHVYIDKISLIPIYEDEWVFAKTKVSREPSSRWVMRRQMRLIMVD